MIPAVIAGPEPGGPRRPPISGRTPGRPAPASAAAELDDVLLGVDDDEVLEDLVDRQLAPDAGGRPAGPSRRGPSPARRRA